MFDPKIKARWIKALLGGRYKQTTGCLGDQYGNCCLGVLCRVLRLQQNKPSWRAPTRGSRQVGFKGTTGPTEYGCVPGDIKKQIGLSVPNESKLVSLNDGGRDFKYIAEWIREHL